jgi:hypothetical protein
MDRSKKSEKNSMSKKNGNPYNDMDETLPMKKLQGKKKDKNWKNHLLDNVEDEAIDMSSLEDFKGFDDPIDEEGEEAS